MRVSSLKNVFEKSVFETFKSVHYSGTQSCQHIGTFSKEKTLSVISYSPSWDGSCSRPESCTECPAFIKTKSRYMLQTSNYINPATIVTFLPVHYQGDNPYKCGKLYLGSLYRSLAVMFTLKMLAPNPFNLRGLVLDTCSNSLRIDQNLYNILARGKLCNSNTKFDGIINNSTVGGVLTDSSANVMAANRIIAPLKIPLVGSLSTSSVLNDKLNYPYVARTISPDTQEMQTIVNILKNQNWTCVSVVYSKEVYGLTAYANFIRQSKISGICIAKSISISNTASQQEMQNVLSELLNQTFANVVIVIAINPRPILETANTLGILKQYLWIGTATWGNLNSVVSGLDNNVLGSITVSMRNTVVKQFNAFLKSLTYSNRADVPNDWFEEFYQEVHKCRLSNASVVYSQYMPCSLSEIITDDKLQINKYVIYTTVAATYAIASAIERTKNSMCPTASKFEDCFSNIDNKEHLFKTLLDTKWSGWTEDPGFDLNFNTDRFWDVGYDVFNFIRENATFVYKKVGSSVNENPGKLLNLQKYKSESFKSECPQGKKCNCDAVARQQTSFLPQIRKAEEITAPRNYYFYDMQKLVNGDLLYTQHFTWPIWAIAVSVLTCVGLFIAIFIFCFFLCAYPVRGGSTALGFMMLLGVIFIYALNFAFFLRATDLTCGLRRFLMGVVYAVVFGALLVKSVDNWRFNDTEYSVRKYSGLTSPATLFAIAVGIVCIQIIIPIEWLIIVSPTASNVSPNKALHDWWWCDPIENHDYSLVLSMLFVIFLVIVTAVFSGMAWDSQSNYYESRWIFVSCISTAGCFLVWMVVSTNAGPPYRDPAVALGNFLNATALLICLPIRKLYLLFYFNRQDDKEQLEEDTYAHMDQGPEIYSTLYSNEEFEDVFQPMDMKSDAENGF